MSLAVQEIVNGWINTVFPNEKIEEVAVDRLRVCLTPDGEEPYCRYYNPRGILGAKCDACGCPLKMKIRSETTTCPEKKWKK